MVLLRLVDLLNTLLAMGPGTDRWHDVPTTVAVVVQRRE
jgi:hypothetical protein